MLFRPSVMPYVQPNYEYYAANIMNSQFMMYQQLAQQFPPASAVAPAIRPSLGKPSMSITIPYIYYYHYLEKLL